jgi:hypothetical protein
LVDLTEAAESIDCDPTRNPPTSAMAKVERPTLRHQIESLMLGRTPMRLHGQGGALPEPGQWEIGNDPQPVGLDEARSIVRELLERDVWDSQCGTLMVGSGTENDEVYTFDYGAREFFDGDLSKALVGYLLFIVRKGDGAFTRYLPGLHRCRTAPRNTPTFARWTANNETP